MSLNVIRTGEKECNLALACVVGLQVQLKEPIGRATGSFYRSFSIGVAIADSEHKKASSSLFCEVVITRGIIE